MAFSQPKDDLQPLPEVQAQVLSAVMRHVYLWMCFALGVTSIVSVLLIYTPLIRVLVGIVQTPWIFFGLLIGELGLVWWLNARMARLSVGAARFWFTLYAILNGITLSPLFLVYTEGSIALTFIASACLFGALGLIGYTTKKDLSGWGRYMFIGLLGIIIASVVNLFLANSVLDWILTYVGLFIFLGITIYDTQRIKRSVAAALQMGDSDVLDRLGLLGALSLYLDFINLFIRLLRIFGRRRR